MSELLVNNIAVTSLDVAFAREGSWRADLVIDADVTFARGDLITVTDASGTTLLQGRVLRSDTPFQRAEVRVIGGAGKLGTRVAPKYYRDAPARTILDDLARETGSVFEAGVLEQPELQSTIAAWVRRGGEAISALNELIRDGLPTGWTWRNRANGELWVGPETWPNVIAIDVEEYARDGARGTLGVRAPTIAALLAIEPGMVWNDKPIQTVRVRSSEDKLFATITTGPKDTVDPVLGLARKLAIDANLHTMYHALYSARVLEQDAVTGDVSVLLQPDLDESLRTMPALTEVPLRAPFPGGRVLFSAAQIGAGDIHIIVGFEDGNPAKPYAVPWSAKRTVEPNMVNIDAFSTIALGGDTRGVARFNDSVSKSALMETWMSQVTTAVNGLAPASVTPLVSATIGAISSASEKLKTG
jgi:hypothetical protein